MYDAISALIGGRTISAGGAVIEVVNPSTGRSFLRVERGNNAVVDQAVASARQAFEDGRWRDLPPSARKSALHRLAALIENEAPNLDLLDAEEMGKPVSEKRANAAVAAGLARYCAEGLDKLTGTAFVSDPKSVILDRREPRGVVGAIVPWNFPTYNTLSKLAPALAAGNSVIVKPSELASRSALRIAELALDAGIPPGAVNVLPGAGDVVGKAIAAHADIDMVTFTGSTVVGKLICQYAGASNMKVVVAECGGKSPHIVLADNTDLGPVAEGIATMLVANQGQICSVGSRLIVHRSLERELVREIAERIGRVTMGDAANPATTFGPIVTRRQRDRILSVIRQAQEDGAEIAAGGRAVREESGGSFLEPTIIRDVAPDATIAQSELFGPVLTVLPFATEDEAIRLANGTVYGLAAYVWTNNLSAALRMAKGIRSGALINAALPTGEGAGHALSVEPFGQSGIGIEGGLAGMEQYTRRKFAWINHS